MKSRHWMSLGAQSLNVEWTDWFCHSLRRVWGRRGEGWRGVASEPFTALGLSGDVKEGVWGGWVLWVVVGGLLLVNMTGNKHLGIVFQRRGH